MPGLLPSDEHWLKLREIQLHKANYNKRNLRMTAKACCIACAGNAPGETFPRHS